MAMTAQAAKSPFLLTPATTSTLTSMTAGLVTILTLTPRMNYGMLNSGRLLTKAHTYYRLQHGPHGNSLTRLTMTMITTTATTNRMARSLMRMSSMESNQQKAPLQHQPSVVS